MTDYGVCELNEGLCYPDAGVCQKSFRYVQIVIKKGRFVNEKEFPNVLDCYLEFTQSLCFK